MWYDTHSSVRLGDQSEFWKTESVTRAVLKSDSGTWARLSWDFLRGIFLSIHLQYIGFWERYTYWVWVLFSLYAADLFKAISQYHLYNNWNPYCDLFFWGGGEEMIIIYVTDNIQRNYWKMSYPKRLFEYFQCPILLHYNLK